VTELREQVDRVADHARKENWGAEAVEFFAEFLENLGVGEEEK
jgi:hypothetical protein